MQCSLSLVRGGVFNLLVRKSDQSEGTRMTERACCLTLKKPVCPWSLLPKCQRCKSKFSHHPKWKSPLDTSTPLPVNFSASSLTHCCIKLVSPVSALLSETVSWILGNPTAGFFGHRMRAPSVSAIFLQSQFRSGMCGGLWLHS